MAGDGLWKLPRRGNRGKTNCMFSHRFHRAWKTRQKTTAPSFPQFPQPLRLSFLRKGKKKPGFAKGFGQNRMDKKESGA